MRVILEKLKNQGIEKIYQEIGIIKEVMMNYNRRLLKMKILLMVILEERKKYSRTMEI